MTIPERFVWAAGTLAVADLTTDDYIENFPRAADQPGIVDWRFDLDSADVYSEYTERIEALDGSLGTFGDGTFTWISGPLSPGMQDWLRANLFAGGLQAAATVVTPDRGSLTNAWRAVNCTVNWPDVRRAAIPLGNGYFKMRFDFFDAVAAPES